MRPLACLLMLTLTGCGASHGPSASVSGVVTSGGKPLDNISVYFQPVGDPNAKTKEAGMASFGVTDSEGRFELRFTDDESRGALIGEHLVTLNDLNYTGIDESGEENDAGIDPREEEMRRIPVVWARAEHRFTVSEGGTTEANFEVGEMKAAKK